MRYKIVEIRLAHKTVNPADPTMITKKLGEQVVGEANTFEEAQQKLEHMEEQDEKSNEMDLAMCGGDSELMPHQDIVERYVFDTIEKQVYILGCVETGVEDTEWGKIPTCESLLCPLKDVTSINMIHPDGWQM